MKTHIKQIYTPRAKSIMEKASKQTGSFVTGKPLSINKYGIDQDRKLTFVSFKTERGMEDIYMSRFDCLASAEADTNEIFQFNLNS